MITFTKKDDDKQFISVLIEDGTATCKVLDYLLTAFPFASKAYYCHDFNELIFKIENDIQYNIPLKTFSIAVNQMAKAKVTHFCVDVNALNQRFND